MSRTFPQSFLPGDSFGLSSVVSFHKCFQALSACQLAVEMHRCRCHGVVLANESRPSEAKSGPVHTNYNNLW